MNKSKLNRAEVFAKYAADGWSGDAVAMDERSFNAALNDLFGHECLQFDCDGMCDAPQNHIKQGTALELRAALEDANSLCRSAYSIAERKGSQTNWDSFLGQLKQSLDRQHRVMYPHRHAIAETSPTPPPIIINGPNGEKLVNTGQFRCPNRGEWLLWGNGKPRIAAGDYNHKRDILRLATTEEIERAGKGSK